MKKILFVVFLMAINVTQIGSILGNPIHVSSSTTHTPTPPYSGNNPLTGLPAENPSLLNYPPALVSISNFPVSARPQAGLSYSPIVYEMYIGEGMTRFLAVFYGDFAPTNLPNSTSNSKVTLDNSQIGPIRSGRLHCRTAQIPGGAAWMYP